MKYFIKISAPPTSAGVPRGAFMVYVHGDNQLELIETIDEGFQGVMRMEALHMGATMLARFNVPVSEYNAIVKGVK